MKLLHLDSSIFGKNSVSRNMSAEIVARYKANHPAMSVKYRDLASEPIPHLSEVFLRALRGKPGHIESGQQHDLSMSEALLAEFQEADVIVIGVALYNFTVPTQLKAWIDRIVINGKTFRSTGAGPVGLAGGKKIVLAVARGNVYGPDSPAAAWEHAETYMRTVFGFLGVTDIEAVIAEGLSVSPEQRIDAMASASRQIASLKI